MILSRGEPITDYGAESSLSESTNLANVVYEAAVGETVIERLG